MVSLISACLDNVCNVLWIVLLMGHVDMHCEPAHFALPLAILIVFTRRRRAAMVEQHWEMSRMVGKRGGGGGWLRMG